MLAKPMSAANDRTTRLGMALSPIARQNVFERGSLRTSCKPASVNWPRNGIFVGIRIGSLGLASCAKRFYAQGEQGSSVEPISLLDRKRVRRTLPNGPDALLQVPTARTLPLLDNALCLGRITPVCKTILGSSSATFGSHCSCQREAQDY